MSPEKITNEARQRELFNSIAGTYARKDLTPSCITARRLRLTQTIQAAPTQPSANIIEIGCGAGFTARYLEGAYSSYLGVDFAENLIEYAKHHNSSANARFEAMDFRECPESESADLVLMIGLLHHLDDLAASLAQTKRLIRPGGWLVANEPQPSNRLIHLARQVRKHLDPQYSDSQRELSATELCQALKSAGFEDVRIVPQGILSTPFAEVPLSPQWLFKPLADGASLVDRWLERSFGRHLGRVSWNLIAVGRKPIDPERTTPSA